MDIIQKWTDERLVWDPAEWSGIQHLNIPISDLWVPDHQFVLRFVVFGKFPLSADIKEIAIANSRLRHDGFIVVDMLRV